MLLDHMSLQWVSVSLAVLGIGLGAWLLLVSKRRGAALTVPLVTCLVLGAAAVGLANTTYDAIYEKLLFKGDYTADTRFAHTIETRSGVINVTQEGKIYGGGVYDGVFSVGLMPDRNIIVRAYAFAATHEQPREVLMVGLSSGSWAQVIAHMPGLEKLTIIEINPGYLELIKRYPEVVSLLDNPKVDIVIDDGRRWLIANPSRRFDMVVQNTTWHWRGHITNLLSSEYFELIRSHLNAGGVFGYNTTNSHAALKTGCTVFKGGFRVRSFNYVSDAPLSLNRTRWRAALEAWRIDGKPVFDLTQPVDVARLEELLHYEDGRSGSVIDEDWHADCAEILKKAADFPVITDDNMETEFYRRWWWGV